MRSRAAGTRSAETTAAEVRSKDSEFPFPPVAPLTVSAAEVDEALEKLDASFAAIGA